MKNMHEKWELIQMQALPLEAKVVKTQLRIREWYEHFNGDVYVSFSGGKDSTVLAHLVRDLYPDVPLVFSNTGLEYPEIQAFARKMGAVFVKPKMSFSEVVSEYGYPLISKEVAEAIEVSRSLVVGKWCSAKRKELQGKRKNSNGTSSMFNKQKWFPLCRETQFKISKLCCLAMKKKVMHQYEMETGRVPYIGTLTDESLLREQAWLKHGCNSFDKKRKSSQPLSFWKEQDVLRYIKHEGLEISCVYGKIVTVDCDGFEYEPLLDESAKLKCTGCQRTGCIFCGFGCHLEKGETRFQRLAKTHPKQYEYCMGGGQWVDNPKYDPTALPYDGDWENWNPKKIWVPSKKGLGMKKVLDDCNQIYGKGFIKYD